MPVICKAGKADDSSRFLVRTCTIERLLVLSPSYFVCGTTRREYILFLGPFFSPGRFTPSFLSHYVTSADLAGADAEPAAFIFTTTDHRPPASLPHLHSHFTFHSTNTTNTNARIAATVTVHYLPPPPPAPCSHWVLAAEFLTWCCSQFHWDHTSPPSISRAALRIASESVAGHFGSASQRTFIPPSNTVSCARARAGPVGLD